MANVSKYVTYQVGSTFSVVLPILPLLVVADRTVTHTLSFSDHSLLQVSLTTFSLWHYVSACRHGLI